LARFDGNLEAAGEAKLELEELLAAFPKTAGKTVAARQDAIACFLSASEGWQQARSALKGAFAAAPGPAWLKPGKE